MVKNKNNFLYKLFDLFASVKLSVIILVLLASTSIIGTVIPQGEHYQAYINKYGEAVTKIFYAFDLIDMYHSWWFVTLELLLCINIMVCSINRFKKDKDQLFTEFPKFNIKFFLRSENKKEIISDKPVKEVLNLYQEAVGKSFSYSRTEESDIGHVIFAEKGRKSALGVYIVHASVIILLAGTLIGSLFGFDGFLNLAEGETASQVRLKDKNSLIPLDFELRCDNFEVSFYESGAPKEYRSDLTVIENNKEVLKKSIIVNDPLRYKGINIFQASYGMLDPKSVELNFFSKDSEIGYLRKAKMREPYSLPENMGKFIIKGFTGSYKLGGRNIGEAFLVSIDSNTGEGYDVVVPVRFKRFDMMRNGAFIISVEKYDEHYYTGLQVTKDPGVTLIYTGFILIIIGCFIIFFIPHKKLCIHISENSGGSKILIAGISKKDKLGMTSMINRLAALV